MSRTPRQTSPAGSASTHRSSALLRRNSGSSSIGSSSANSWHPPNHDHNHDHDTYPGASAHAHEQITGIHAQIEIKKLKDLLNKPGSQRAKSSRHSHEQPVERSRYSVGSLQESVEDTKKNLWSLWRIRQHEDVRAENCADDLTYKILAKVDVHAEAAKERNVDGFALEHL